MTTTTISSLLNLLLLNLLLLSVSAQEELSKDEIIDILDEVYKDYAGT